MGQAAVEAVTTFAAELLLDFATDKSMIAASSARLARRLHAALGHWAGAAAQSPGTAPHASPICPRHPQPGGTGYDVRQPSCAGSVQSGSSIGESATLMLRARAAAAKARSSASVVVAITLAASVIGYIAVELMSVTYHCTMTSTELAPTAARLSSDASAPAESRRKSGADHSSGPPKTKPR